MCGDGRLGHNVQTPPKREALLAVPLQSSGDVQLQQRDRDLTRRKACAAHYNIDADRGDSKGLDDSFPLLRLKIGGVVAEIGAVGRYRLVGVAQAVP